MWRPDGWKNLKCDTCKDAVIDDYGYQCELSCGERSSYFNFEAGADAILEALRKDYHSFAPHSDDESKLVKGTWCFIPEEEV